MNSNSPSTSPIIFTKNLLIFSQCSSSNNYCHGSWTLTPTHYNRISLSHSFLLSYHSSFIGDFTPSAPLCESLLLAYQNPKFQSYSSFFTHLWKKMLIPLPGQFSCTNSICLEQDLRTNVALLAPDILNIVCPYYVSNYLTENYILLILASAQCGRLSDSVIILHLKLISSSFDNRGLKPYSIFFHCRNQAAGYALCAQLRILGQSQDFLDRM